MARKSSFNWIKNIVQWSTLAVIIFFLTGLARKVFPALEAADPEAYCPMGGLEAFCTYLVRGSLPCTMSSLQILMGLLLAGGVVLFSKLFCAYLCPIGTVEDLLAKLRKLLHLKAIPIKNGSIEDKVLRVMKYGLVFYIFYSTISASELFCKALDPYYAVATGFKGEIVLWMSIVSLFLVIVPGVLIDRFWCKYICPLGAISNGLKFWFWTLLVFAVWYFANLLGLEISWIWMLGAFCLTAYLLEILSGKPKLQLIHVMQDESNCNRCGLCERSCPYGIAIGSFGGKVTSVDCTLCGDCVYACKKDALHIGVARNSENKLWKRMIPAVLALCLMGAGMFFGKRFEIPTINEVWGINGYDKDSTLIQIVDPNSLESMTVENLRTVKCFGSSMAFKAKVEKINGTHGVKTFVNSHKVVIKYDPKVVDQETILAKIFVPSHFRVNSPDPKAVNAVKVQTIRVEKMYDKLDLNYLGLQMRLTGKKIYGLDSQYDCPVKVRVYMDSTEVLDKEWYKEVVNKESLDMPVHGGGVKSTPMSLEFVRVEPGDTTMDISSYLHMMFDGFKAEYNGSYKQKDGEKKIEKRATHYEKKKQYIYEIADQDYEKPIIKKALPFLSNWLSSAEGVIGMYLELNDELIPSIKVRYAYPMTSDKIWEMMTAEKWKITYKKDDVREEDARMKFETPGVSYPYVVKEPEKTAKK